MNKQKGFTLIELLMVIAVVSLLSTIVLGSLNDAREKGRIAAIQKFSSNLHHTTGDYLVGEWKFDQDTLVDTSGFGNNGAFQGDIDVDDFTGGVMGRALAFKNIGIAEYVDVGNQAGKDINDEMTAEMWVKMTYSLDRRYYSLRKNSSYMMRVYSYPTSVPYGYPLNDGYKFSVVSGAGVYESGDYSMNQYETWHHVVGTAKMGETVKLYIDGQLRSEGAVLPGHINFNVNTLRIGEAAMPVIIDNVRIYNKAATLAQIQKHYAEGLLDHQTLASK
ncbi:MAG: prepilin-type N-terminal cleavage/methylation domain-containing protein [Candidatus Aenigmarchaeota archaeon]|nr:prepilin-type N-terminal cleavage/methylation domain-containing protein [Candidatus Aenigmarchaeota archaeon]